MKKFSGTIKSRLLNVSNCTHHCYYIYIYIYIKLALLHLKKYKKH